MDEIPLQGPLCVETLGTASSGNYEDHAPPEGVRPRPVSGAIEKNADASWAVYKEDALNTTPL